MLCWRFAPEQPNKRRQLCTPLLCCPAIFRTQKQVAALPPPWGTPVLAVTIAPPIIEEKSTPPAILDKISPTHTYINQPLFAPDIINSEIFTPPAEPSLPCAPPSPQKSLETEENAAITSVEELILKTPRETELIENEEEVRQQVFHKLIRENTLANFDHIYTDNDNGIKKGISKSEWDVTRSIFDAKRKTIASAPSKNKFYGSDENETPVQTPPPFEVKNEPVEAEVEINTTEVLAQTKTPKKLKKQLSRSFAAPRCSVSRGRQQEDFVEQLASPRESLGEVLKHLEDSDWEVTMKGLRGLARLIRHHPEILDERMHHATIYLGKHICNLRSQVARNACTVAGEMFFTYNKTLDVELENIVAPLFHRTADTNKFLRADANQALDAMVATLPPQRIVALVTQRGCAHQNAIVRCAAARLINKLVQRLGPEKIFQLPKDVKNRIVLCGANFLMEGNSETRKHAKQLYQQLSGHCHFQRTLNEAVPPSTLRHISKTLDSLK